MQCDATNPVIFIQISDDKARALWMGISYIETAMSSRKINTDQWSARAGAELAQRGASRERNKVVLWHPISKAATRAQDNTTRPGTAHYAQTHFIVFSIPFPMSFTLRPASNAQFGPISVSCVLRWRLEILLFRSVPRPAPRDPGVTLMQPMRGKMWRNQSTSGPTQL